MTESLSRFRDYSFLGTTKSLCPECLQLVDAKIVSRDNSTAPEKTLSAATPATLIATNLACPVKLPVPSA